MVCASRAFLNTRAQQESELSVGELLICVNNGCGSDYEVRGQVYVGGRW